MRSSEFESGADNIKFEFEKTLCALRARYKKQLKIHKNKLRIAKQQIKNNKIRALRNDSTINVSKPDRPKR